MGTIQTDFPIDQPRPGGCIAINLLKEEREAFRSSVKDPVNALWHILRMLKNAELCVNNNGLVDQGDVAVLHDRIQGVCTWALSGNPRDLNPVDRVFLFPPDPSASQPGQPSAPGTPPA